MWIEIKVTLFLFRQVLDSFFIVLSDSGDVFFVSENVYRYLGYTQVQFIFCQTYSMYTLGEHQRDNNFFLWKINDGCIKQFQISVCL